MPVVTRKSSRSGPQSEKALNRHLGNCNSKETLDQLIKDFRIISANHKKLRQDKVKDMVNSFTKNGNILIAKLPKKMQNTKVNDWIENENFDVRDSYATALNKVLSIDGMGTGQPSKHLKINAPKKAVSDSKVLNKPALRIRKIKSNQTQRIVRNKTNRSTTTTENKENRAFAAISVITGNEPAMSNIRVKPMKTTLAEHLTSIELLDENSKLFITRSSGETMTIDDLLSNQLDEKSIQSLREITKTLTNFLEK